MLKESYILAGTGQTVIMLHSSMSSKSQWKALVKQVAETHQVIAIDLLGYGGAPFPSHPDSYSLQDEKQHIDQVLEDVGVDKDRPVKLVGHSFGGATALSWAYDNQVRVHSLHLYEPVAFHLLEAPCTGLENISGVIHHLEEAMAKGEKEATTQAFIDYWSGPGAFHAFPPHIRDVMTGQIDKVVLDFKGLMGEPNTLADYATLSCPVDLIMGNQSPLSSQTIALRLKDSMKQLVFHQVDAGHMGPITHPHLVNPIFQRSLGA